MAIERLSALDASFLELETPTAHMHVGWRARFAAPPAGRSVTLGRLRDLIGARLPLAPRFGQRLVAAPGGLGAPCWVADESFELDRHVGLLDGRGQLSHARFEALADRVLSEPLDRSHPLWRTYLAPRLSDGSVGLVMKMHHAMVDGVSAAALGLLLLDVDPDAPPPPGRPRPAHGTRTEWSPPATEALADAWREPLRAAGRLARLTADPRRGVRLAGTLQRAALSVREDLLGEAPAWNLNVPVGPRRRLIGHSVELERLLAARQAVEGATLNDVALAVVAGALRELALERREMPIDLRVMIPVSHRTTDQSAALGNRISFVFIDLPVRRRSVRARLEAIRRQTAAFKSGGRATGNAAVIGALGVVPPPLRRHVARAAASPRLFNLTVSNVPGPRQPVYLLGARLVEAFPVVPLAPRHALSIGVFSTAEHACFGAHVDPEALPQASALRAALSAAMVELDGLGRAQRGRRGAMIR